MVKYYFSDYQNIYTEDILIKMIIQVINTDFKDNIIEVNQYIIAELLKHIESSSVLHATLNLIEDFQYISGRSKFDDKITAATQYQNFSSKQIIKINAISFSELVYYTIRCKEIRNRKGIPLLDLHFKEKYVTSNRDEISTWIKRKSAVQITNSIQCLPLSEQENHFKSIIASMAKIDYENDTNFFKPEREYFNELKQNLTSYYQNSGLQIVKNPHPEMFTGEDNATYSFFKEFIENTKITLHKDWGFLFQFMLHDRLIVYQQHTDFIRWTFKHGFISKDLYDNFDVKRSFPSYSKSIGNPYKATYESLKSKYFNLNSTFSK